MFVATQHGAGEPAPSGYAQLPPSIMQQMGLPIMVPPEVVMAMRFLDMCHAVTKPLPLMDVGEDTVYTGDYFLPEMHPCEEAVLRRACVCLGRYFDGRGPRRAK
jgi:hypothetical protein